jgi:TolA-binding protein
VAWERTLPPNGPIAVQAVDVLLDRVDRFLAAFPGDARNPDLLMKAAETAERAQLAERAHDAAQRLVTAYPKSRWTAQATRLIGQTLYDRGEYRAAERAFRQALTTASGAQADALAGLAASALYQDAVAQRAAGQAPIAARTFTKLADDFPTTAVAPLALLAAADLASASGDAPGAKRLWTRVANDYRTSDQATPALRHLAAAAIKDGDPAGAIGWYEALAARSTPPARDDLTWTIAELAEQSHLWPRAERAFAELATRPDLDPTRSIEAGFRATEAVTHQGRRDEASQRAETTLDRYRVWRAQRGTGADLTAVDALAGAALLGLADRRAAACVAVSLVNPLEQTLARKQAALDLALVTYAEAADLRLAGVATAATHKIGGLLDEFFHALLKSERPGELTPAQIEQYTILLEERAAPLEERAVAAYETNVRRAQELGLYDEWIGKSFERLAVLRPARYQRPERAELVRRTLEAPR